MNPTIRLMWSEVQATGVAQCSTMEEAKRSTGIAALTATAASDCTSVPTAQAIWPGSRVQTGATMCPAWIFSHTRSPTVRGTSKLTLNA